MKTEDFLKEATVKGLKLKLKFNLRTHLTSIVLLSLVLIFVAAIL